FNTASNAARALTAGRMSGPQEAVPADRVAKELSQERTTVIPTGERTAAKNPKASASFVAGAPAPGGRSKTGIIVVLVLLLLGGGALAYWFFGRSVLIVENHLVEPVEISLPGAQRRTVEPGGEVSIPVGASSAAPISWVLVRPTTPSGAGMGLELAGTIGTDIPRGTTRKVIDGRSFEAPAFAPLISNA